MFAFAVTAVGLLAVFLLALAVPVVLDVDVKRVETLSASWRVRWLFGVLSVRSPDGTRARPRPGRSGPGSSRRTARRTKPPKRGLSAGVAALRTPGLVRRVVGLLAGLARQVRCDRFGLHADFGFDDPADTGVLFGVLSPLLVAADVRGLNVRCRPLFDDAGLRGTCGITIRIRPLFVLGVIAAFVFSPAVVRATAAAWRAS